MKVLIISDSHGRNTYLDRVLKKAGPFDMLLHLGDLEGSEAYIKEAAGCPVEMVSGNNDYFTGIDRERLIEIKGHKIFMVHGHRHQVGFGLDYLRKAAGEMGANIALYGHTHMPLIEYGEITVANPGSISQPRQEGRIPTYLILEIDRFNKLHFTLNYIK